MFDLPQGSAAFRGLSASSSIQLASKMKLAQYNLPDLEITPVLMKTELCSNKASSLQEKNTKAMKASMDSTKCNAILMTRSYQNTQQARRIWAARRKVWFVEEEKAITKLLCNLPILDQNFILHKKIGEGTYSTVYLASLKNTLLKSRQYAIKHLTDNFSFSRVQKELRFMQIIGGSDNVVSVLNHFKSSTKDCVVFVMPYLPHKRFSDYCLDMDANELRVYMKNLFIALRRVHSFNVIHRDVKPGNFLYNRDTGEFLLVDFGLAQEISVKEVREKHLKLERDENMPINYSKRKRSSTDDGHCYAKKVMSLSPLKSRENIVNAPKSPTERRGGSSLYCPSSATSPLLQYQRTGQRTQSESPSISSDLSFNKSVNLSHNVPSNLSNSVSRRETSLGTSLLKSQVESKLASTPKFVGSMFDDSRKFTPLVGSSVPVESFVQVRNSQVVIKEPTACACAGLPSICSPCAGKRTLAAPRAGTPGFRPPEVLLKCLHQTTAVDMWAAGIVLLCVLSGTYPFFKSPSDLAALMEIITVFGTAAVQDVAKNSGMRLPCSENLPPLDLKKVCRRRRARFINKKYPVPTSKCQICRQNVREDGCMCSTEPLSCENVHYDGDKFPDSAYHLLSRLLDLNPQTRLTAEEALKHPFITQVSL